MPEFRIANYRVSQTLERFALKPTVTRRSRSIWLESGFLYHNIVVTAELAFVTPNFDNWSGAGVVGYAQNLHTFAPHIAGWYPLAEYETVYELFRNERPLYLVYELQNALQDRSYITLLQVRSDRVALEPFGTIERASPWIDKLPLAGRSEPLPARMPVGPASGQLPPEVLEEAMQDQVAEGEPGRP